MEHHSKLLKPIVVITLLALSGVQALSGEPTHAQPTRTPSAVPMELDGLHDRLVKIMTDLRVPGLAVAVVRDNEIIYSDALGIRDPEKNLPVTPDTIFYIASCTKTFMAMAVASLVEEGKLDLDAPVKQYLPRFKIADKALTESLTIRDLLCHAKGINNGPIVWLDAFTGEITEDRYYYWLQQATARGSHAYTNLHYTLAGRIVESVTGKSWKDFLEERIFKPVGMTRTTCYASQMYGDADAGIPTKWDNGAFVPTAVRKTDAVMHAAGGMGSSATDLARWLIVNLNGGVIEGTRLLSEEGTQEMQTLQAKGGRGLPRYLKRTGQGHGLGWAIGTYKNERYIDHGGGYKGASAAMSFMPDHGIGVAVVANASGIATQLVSMEIYDRLLGLEGADLLPKIKKSSEKRARRNAREQVKSTKNPTAKGGLSQAPDAYVGTYENDHWGSVRIDYRNGELVGQAGILTVRFSSAGKDRFQADYGTGRTSRGRFEVTNDRVSALIVEPENFSGEVRYSRR